MRVTSTMLPDMGLKCVTEAWWVWRVTQPSMDHDTCTGCNSGLCRNNAPITQFLNLLTLQLSLCSLRSQLNDQISSMYLQNHLISYKKNWNWPQKLALTKNWALNAGKVSNWCNLRHRSQLWGDWRFKISLNQEDDFGSDLNPAIWDSWTQENLVQHVMYIDWFKSHDMEIILTPINYSKTQLWHSSWMTGTIWQWQCAWP